MPKIYPGRDSLRFPVVFPSIPDREQADPYWMQARRDSRFKALIRQEAAVRIEMTG